MTISRKLTSITTAIGDRRGELRRRWPLRPAPAAMIGYRGDGYGGRHYSRGYDGGYRGDDGYRGGRDRYYARHYRRQDNTGKYIALGVGALMLGIIASEASRR